MMINRINNEKGAILIITLTFIFAFTALGIGAIYHAGKQNENTDILKASTEAFWLADAAVERGRSQIPTTLYSATDPNNQNLSPFGYNRGTYDIASDVDTNSCGVDGNGNPITCSERWQINAIGRVNSQSRQIEADIARHGITNAITSKGTVNGGCGPQGSATIEGTCESSADFTFSQIFNGTSYAAVVADADNTFIDPQNNDVDMVNGVTYIQMITDSSININTDNQTLVGGVPVGSLLIIDTSAASGNISVTFGGSYDFYGIIWVVGEVEIVGNTDFKGSIFVDGDPSLDTKVSGNSDVSYNSNAITEAAGQIDSSIFTGNLEIVSWKEI